MKGTARARELVLQYGWNSTCYQILNPGIELWFSRATSAVVGYTRRPGLFLVAGAPVCAPESLYDVCREFETFAHAQDSRVCYVCAEERLRSIFAGSRDHDTIALGAQPVWNPRAWPQIVQSHSALRAQLNRSRNKSVSIETLAPEEAAADPHLRQVLHEWLQSRSLPPMHFLVEPDVLSEDAKERVVLVAKRESKTVAYLVASPIAAREGYLVELLARTSAAPNGTSELLVDAAMRRFAGQGKLYVTLGLVALASAADQDIHCNPYWLRSLMRFARVHANRFYNFRGLEYFRVKMEPARWEPIYAISTERRFSISTLYGIGAAFSGVPPWLAIGIGAAKALRQELQHSFPR